MNETAFSNSLRQAIKAKGMTQDQLATLSGVAQATISRAINGKGNIRFGTLTALWPFVYGAPFPQMPEPEAPAQEHSSEPAHAE